MEIHTAYCVAKEGTVSKAAEVLGVHRATVNRHIEMLENQLGVRLFIRHRRGYQLTEAGEEFLNVAGRAHDIRDDFAGRIRVQSSEISGEVIVTTLFPISNVLMPAFRAFRKAHPRTRILLLTDAALLKLGHAEAHIALRAGRAPENDDYVVQPFCELTFALFAHVSYLENHGTPRGLDDMAGHDFVGNPRKRSSAPFEAWRNASSSGPATPWSWRMQSQTASASGSCRSPKPGRGLIFNRSARRLPNGPYVYGW